MECQGHTAGFQVHHSFLEGKKKTYENDKTALVNLPHFPIVAIHVGILANQQLHNQVSRTSERQLCVWAEW